MIQHFSGRVIFAVAIVIFGAYANIFLMPKNFFNDEPVCVDIPADSSASQISGILQDKGIISNRLRFKLAAKLSLSSSKLKSGTYYFRPNMAPITILNMMRSGKGYYGSIKVVIPEGSSVYRIGMTLEKNGIIVVGGSVYDLDKQLITSEVLSKYPFLYGLPVRSLEGYLFPDTYYLPRKIHINMLVQMMLDRFNDIVMPEYIKGNTTKYSLHQIITMASIIEKEAENDPDRPIIASVFYNRLDNDIALRADPTVKYALSSPTKRVTYADLKVNSPYNTYLYKGLPPGPICNPGLKSILAALHPASTKFFYFVSNGDESHTFSQNWEGHKKAVERYKRIRGSK